MLLVQNGAFQEFGASLPLHLDTEGRRPPEQPHFVRVPPEAGALAVAGSELIVPEGHVGANF
jgi:hypothetical protein